MSLTTDEVRKIAALARLELEPGEEAMLTEQLSRIVGYVDQLQKVEVIAPEDAAEDSQLAFDEPLPSLDRALFEANAPQAQDGYLVVPQVKTTGTDGAGE